MIDLHLHVLPAIDDGASSLEISRQMLEQAKANGFTTLVSTPHLQGPLSTDYAGLVEQALVGVRELARPLGVDVLLGYELMLTPDLPARLGRGEPITLAGTKTVLVEVPFSLWPAHTDQILFDLQVAGFRPLLAHPERYHAVQDDPERALHAAERGVILQVTIGSLAGLFGKSARRTAELLVQVAEGVVVATDAHSSGRRLGAVNEGLERLRALVGDAAARQFVEDGPLAILTDAPMPVAGERAPVTSNGRWGSRFRRLIMSDR